MLASSVFEPADAGQLALFATKHVRVLTSQHVAPDVDEHAVAQSLSVEHEAVHAPPEEVPPSELELSALVPPSLPKLVFGSPVFSSPVDGALFDEHAVAASTAPIARTESDREGSFMGIGFIVKDLRA